MMCMKIRLLFRHRMWTMYCLHAHIDHSGLIPLLYVHGFRGKVYCTEATVQLCDVMLRDSAHIHTDVQAEWRNRKAKRSNGTPKEFLMPPYDAKYMKL